MLQVDTTSTRWLVSRVPTRSVVRDEVRNVVDLVKSSLNSGCWSLFVIRPPKARTTNNQQPGTNIE